MRIQFINLVEHDRFGPLTCEGDVILTCYDGRRQLGVEGTSSELQEMDQVVIAPKQRFLVECLTPRATIQVIWAPGFANVQQP